MNVSTLIQETKGKLPKRKLKKYLDVSLGENPKEQRRIKRIKK